MFVACGEGLGDGRSNEVRKAAPLPRRFERAAVGAEGSGSDDIRSGAQVLEVQVAEDAAAFVAQERDRGEERRPGIEAPLAQLGSHRSVEDHHPVAIRIGVW